MTTVEFDFPNLQSISIEGHADGREVAIAKFETKLPDGKVMQRRIQSFCIHRKGRPKAEARMEAINYCLRAFKTEVICMIGCTEAISL